MVHGSHETAVSPWSDGIKKCAIIESAKRPLTKDLHVAIRTAEAENSSLGYAKGDGCSSDRPLFISYCIFHIILYLFSTPDSGCCASLVLLNIYIRLTDGNSCRVHSPVLSDPPDNQ